MTRTNNPRLRPANLTVLLLLATSCISKPSAQLIDLRPIHIGMSADGVRQAIEKIGPAAAYTNGDLDVTLKHELFKSVSCDFFKVKGIVSDCTFAIKPDVSLEQLEQLGVQLESLDQSLAGTREKMIRDQVTGEWSIEIRGPFATGFIKKPLILISPSWEDGKYSGGGFVSFGFNLACTKNVEDARMCDDVFQAFLGPTTNGISP